MLLVIPDFLNQSEVRDFRATLAQAPWRDGRDSAGSLSIQVKDNQQVDDDSSIAHDLGNRILGMLGRNALFVSAALPNRFFPPRFNRYAGGGHYWTHIDAALMYSDRLSQAVRSDLSATLFLADPEDYDGGELVVETAFGAQEVKLAAGALVLYPSSSLHRVEPVTRGARLAAILWLQSLVRDAAQRALLFDLDQSVQALSRQLPPTDPELLRLSGVYHNLLRMWAEA
ncbi:MAG: Fe2+-dependent dioxygenase [Pseudomonadales bacterium]|nr:Fe2+-dependent dioxygenase [Pseudomonadales bacterium]